MAVKEGATVGLWLDAAEGVLVVVENGEDTGVEAPFDVPTDAPLYAIVDLLGTAQAVKLCPGAKPPV